MARGRMLSKSLSTSQCFATLNLTAGRLAEFSQTLYMLLLAHADDWGCQSGDAFTVKLRVHPTSPRRLPDFDRALKLLHNAHLVTLYEHRGQTWVYIRGWFAHQQLKGHVTDGRPRTSPPPPENPKDFGDFAQSRPNPPKVALREEKRREEKRTYTDEIPVADATAEVDADLDQSDTTSRQAVGAFLKGWCELYLKHRRVRYTVHRARDVPLVRRLLAIYPTAHLLKLTVILLTTDDDWIAATDRGIGILSTKINWLGDKLAIYEAAHGAIGVAS